MLKPLLIEIGVEELPALPLLKIINDIEKNWSDILEHNRLLCEFEFFYTPRRLVLWHPQFPVQQSDSKEELWGPPTQIAYDKDGKPTKAALGFAKKCGVDLSQIDTKERGGKAFLYYFKQQEGQKSAHLLQQMLGQWLESMAFGKMMRWGERKDE
ncbi:MAG: glycine--tRNA ligase subunit beta, partial [Campylobacterota bacterium]